MRDPLHLEVTP